MISGIGVDMTTISRIEKVHKRFGARFARRILDAQELEDYLSHTHQAAFLAKRFAIKEAACKAIGTGERNGVLLKHFALTHNHLGKPLLQVKGHAKKLMEQLGITHSHVSVSDEGNTVIAFVVLERV